MQTKSDPRGITHGGSVTYAAGAGSPQPTPQVEAQLDSAMFSMEALENTVSSFIARLEPITGVSTFAEAAVDCISGSLVPVAARISYLEQRARNCEAQLSRALNALQV